MSGETAGLIDESFPRSYRLERLPELPNSPSLPRYYHPGGSQESGHDGLIMVVRPEQGAPWLGVFSGGLRGPEGPCLFTTPDPARFCVGREGPRLYLVNANEPDRSESVTRRMGTKRSSFACIGASDFRRRHTHGGLRQKWCEVADRQRGLRLPAHHSVTDTFIDATGDYHGREGAKARVELATGAWERELPPGTVEERPVRPWRPWWKRWGK